MATRSLVRLSAAVTSAAGLLAGGFIAASPAGAATASSASAADPGCSTGQLPVAVLGNPAPKPGQATGVYLGHGTGANAEAAGYGLAVTHPGTSAVVFTGTITASAPITAAKVRDEKHDIIRLSADKRTLTYRFINYGGLDGVAFRADCANTVRVSVQANGHELSPTSVFLGAHRAHPTSDPFTLERH